LFGVLIINLVMEFRVSIFEQFLNQPSIRGPPDPILDTLLLLLFSQKALALFSLLFGLGLAIQFDRLRENPYRLRLLLRRLTALLAIGLLHLLLIWNGDILQWRDLSCCRFCGDRAGYRPPLSSAFISSCRFFP
jgi:uncharacterized protein